MRPASAMGLGDVSTSVVPKPVLVSAGDDEDSLCSRYFTPRRCHASHAVTGAIGVAAAFALPGTVGQRRRAAQRHAPGVGAAPAGPHRRDRVHRWRRPEQARIARAALVRTARKILQGELHIPDYVFSTKTPSPIEGDKPMKKMLAPILAAAAVSAAAPALAAFPTKAITIVVPTAAGGGNDAMARTIAQKLGPLLGQTLIIDNRAGANGSIASEFVARAAPDGHTLMFGYIATHSMNPALQKLRYDPVADFEPVGPGGLFADADGGACRHAGEGREGPDRAAACQARQVHLCLGRQRHRAALRRRALQAECRRRDAGRAVQGLGTGRQRHHRRADAVHVPEPVHRDAARQERQAQGPGCGRPQAQRPAARGAPR